MFRDISTQNCFVKIIIYEDFYHKAITPIFYNRKSICVVQENPKMWVLTSFNVVFSIKIDWQPIEKYVVLLTMCAPQLFSLVLSLVLSVVVSIVFSQVFSLVLSLVFVSVLRILNHMVSRVCCSECSLGVLKHGISFSRPFTLQSTWKWNYRCSCFLKISKPSPFSNSHNKGGEINYFGIYLHSICDVHAAEQKKWNLNSYSLEILGLGSWTG